MSKVTVRVGWRKGTAAVHRSVSMSRERDKMGDDNFDDLLGKFHGSG